MGAAVAEGAVVGVLQQLELVVPAHERGLLHLANLIGLAAQRAPRPDLAVEPLQLDRPDVLDLDTAERQPVRARAQQHLPRVGGLLEPRGDVDGLAGREGRVAVVRDDLARLDPDPRLELQLVHAVQDGQRGANRALGVVLVRLRDPEGGHHGVAGELLDDPAVRGHAVRDAFEVRLDTAAHDLGIGARDERRRVDEIDEQDRCKLAFHAVKCRNDPEARFLPRLA